MFCRCCGYDLQGIAAMRCPECGKSFDARDRSTSDRDAVTFRRRRRVRAFMRLVLALVLLLCLYVVSYELNVRREPPRAMSGIGPWRRLPQYRVGGELSERLFYPCVLADALIFPSRWEFWDCPEELVRILRFIRRERRDNESAQETKAAWSDLVAAIESAKEPYDQLQMINASRDPSMASRLREEIKRRSQLATEAMERYETKRDAWRLRQNPRS